MDLLPINRIKMPIKNKRTGALGLTLIGVVITLCLHAQQINDDFKKLNQKLISRKVNMDISYRLYDSYQAQSPEESQKMQVHMWGQQIHIGSVYFEAVRTQTVYLYINHTQKMMLLNPVHAKTVQKEMVEVEKWFNVDSILKQYPRTELKQNSGDKRVYRLYTDVSGSPYAYMDISINTKTYVLEKMTVYYTHSLDEMMSHKKEKETTKGILPRMEIEFSEYVFPAQIDSRWFSTSTFVAKNKTGKYVPVEKYASYQVIDNINVGKTRHK